MLQKIYISNKHCSFDFSSKNPEKFSQAQLYLTPIVIRNVSEGSCDTETRVTDAEMVFTAKHEIHSHLTYT